MGQTNINAVEHKCSRCRNIRPIREFPYPKEVWWCLLCWQAHREKQSQRQRERRLSALKEYLCKPRPSSWRDVPYRSKGGLLALPPFQREKAESEHNRLVAECKRQGILVTKEKNASLWANAIFIVKYVRTGKMRSWVSNSKKRLKQWQRLQEKQRAEEFKALPLSRRCKVLPCG